MKEDLSAWIDGEASGAQARQLLPRVEHSAELRQAWDCYHLIGDTLRGVRGHDLCARFHARLDTEPTVLAPRRRSSKEKFVRHALSLAASAAAVMFVGWMALSGTEQAAPQVASVSAPSPGPVAVAAGEVANDYLLAHQRYSPSSALQGVAPYVRTVADERRISRR